MMGHSDMAIEAARKVAENVRIEQIEEFPTVEFFDTIPLLALTQFARWEEVLAEPPPPENLVYSTAIRHYARGTAMSRQGDIRGALSEREALASLKDATEVVFMDTQDYPASVLLGIADALLLGDIAMAQGGLETAISHFGEAVEAQDALPYTEPPFWYYPTRQSLGLALLRAGQAAEAEAVYLRDLEDYPMNGWSMFGLVQSLEAQGKTAEAAEMRQMFDRTWVMADVELTGSRL
jgi:tetratricopeptide (TPR) repeat protein